MLEETLSEVVGQAVLGRQEQPTTPWLTVRHGYVPSSIISRENVIESRIRLVSESETSLEKVSKPVASGLRETRTAYNSLDHRTKW
ncbi:hypothetical protein, partial [Proteus faecis]|uniref:hypothetical protein n=1 Tax=Proteus faecis TaxID=2050967 RepID=UPI003075D451